MLGRKQADAGAAFTPNTGIDDAQRAKLHQLHRQLLRSYIAGGAEGIVLDAPQVRGNGAREVRQVVVVLNFFPVFQSISANSTPL